MFEKKFQPTTEHSCFQDIVVRVAGRLAGLFIHELNNVLATLREKAGLADDILAAKKMLDTDKLKGMEQVVSSFDTHLNHAVGLVRSFQVIGKSMESSAGTADLGVQLTMLAPFFEKIARQQLVTLKIEIKDGLPKAAVRPLPLQCLLVALFENLCGICSPGDNIATKARQEASLLVISISTGLKDHEERGTLPWSTSDISALAAPNGISLQFTEGGRGVELRLPRKE